MTGEKIELGDIQAAALGILLAFVDVCRENGLNYYISGGTYLGAVRHKGFIPWDDDVDVAMPRKDYNIFLEIANQQLPDNLRLVYYKNGKDVIHYPAKIENDRYQLIDHTASIPRQVNLWIDIFPLDGLPENRILNKIHRFRLLALRTLFKYSLFDRIVRQDNTDRPWYENLMIRVGKKVKFTKILKPCKCMEALDRALSKYDFYESRYVMNFMGSYKFKSVMEREKIYGNGADYSFEGYSFRGPANYDMYLTQIYGDYMKYPPIEERNWHQTTIVNHRK